MYKPIEVKALKKYKIWVRYEDGSAGEIDLFDLSGKPVFKFWDINKNFEKVYINKDTGAIAWNEEIEICPHSVYYDINNIDPEAEFKSEKGYAFD
ncbi:MAG: DUF2442 domain-containing protein [Cytophagales bacterium]|nr:DUF2442 domain-containing protein [Cytophagales bacterium]